ncbi:putative FAD-linked oxidoreductase YgaK [Cytospora mali]|uniref:FAD-linked oxidoreductase YgaK n=1 Tax=Cytospora mali TaxID=578113 RepID=A0A194VAM1_CYTMA|nr:putative FAD-linked oxidoreductase YgaK [Valsa mali var. pyri (nom. inval.)]
MVQASGTVAPDLNQLRQQLQQFSIPSVFSDSPGYDKLAKPYNHVFNYQPAVICVPEKDEHVANAILFAREHGVKVQAKGGGHSYAAYSSGGKDDSLIVHMRNYSSVELDNETNIAVVGAGVRLGQLAADLFQQGRRAVPHGTIKNVGVAGHFSHGGYGYQSRAWGLALDTIVGLDVVLADGKCLHVTATEHPELFYAFRGAADSFGIITRFYLKTVPAPDRVTLFSYDIEDLVEDVDGATAAFFHIQQFVQHSDIIDRDISFGLYIHDGVWTIWGVFLRDQKHFETRIEPALLHGFNRYVKKFVQSMAWLESLAWFSDSHSNDATEEAFDAFYAQSVIIPENAPLSEKVVRGYFQTMKESRLDPSQAWYAVINLHGGPGSQITAVPADVSAYTHRNMLWVIQHYGFSLNHLPPLLESTKTYITRLTRVIRDGVPEMLQGAEPNYHDPDMVRDTAHSLYYGESAMNQLEALKTEIDPREVFWNPQSIRPTER